MNEDALYGLTEAQLVRWRDPRWPNGPEFLLHAEALAPWHALLEAAAQDGVALTAVSAFRDFHRQAAIFAAKAEGRRPVFDDQEKPLERAAFTDEEWLHRILRYTALPGLSRHHWGTELDVYALDELQQGRTPRLLASEFCNEGPCATVEEWLSHNATRFGFFRPYRQDRGGVAPEPWHLSFRPLAEQFLPQISVEALERIYRQYPIALQALVLAQLPALLERYARRIATD